MNVNSEAQLPYPLTAEQQSLSDILAGAALANTPPSLHEISLIHEWQASLDHDLLDVEARISVITQELVTLKSRQQAICFLQKKHQSKLSAIRRLPLEMLLEIFSYCEAEYGVDLSNLPEHTLWSVRCVCRAWRNAVISHHVPWTGGLYVSTCDVQRCRDPVALLSFLLKRIGCTRPLSLFLDLGLESTSAFEMEMLVKLFQPMGEHSEQWTSVSLQNIPDSLISYLFPNRNALPQLRRLELSICDRSPFIVTTFSTTPLLTHVTLRGLRVEDIRLPWSQLTSAVISDGSSSESELTQESRQMALSLLRICPNLRTLEVEGRVKYHSAIDTRKRFENILVLKVMVPTVIDALQLPALTELHFTSAQTLHNGGVVAAVPHIIQFVEVSGCQLTTLALWDCELPLQFITLLLELTPDLTDLSFHFTILPKDSGSYYDLEHDVAMRTLVSRLYQCDWNDESEVEEESGDDESSSTGTVDSNASSSEEEEEEEEEEATRMSPVVSGFNPQFDFLPKLTVFTYEISVQIDHLPFADDNFADMVGLRFTHSDLRKVDIAFKSERPERVLNFSRSGEDSLTALRLHRGLDISIGDFDGTYAI